jgi:hypothetical protein
MRLWKALNGGDTRTARVRSWLLGSIAVPGAVGIANRMGLGPVRSELSTNAVGRAGFDAMAEVTRVLHIEAEHLIFGHTHWRGSPKGHGEPRLLNTGSWVHMPGLLGRTAAESPYWPGTIVFVDDEGPPRLVGLLDELTRDDLAGKRS